MCICKFIYMHTNICMHAYIYIYICVYTYTHKNVYTYTYTYLHIYTCIYIYIYIYLYVYTYIYIYITYVTCSLHTYQGSESQPREQLSKCPTGQWRCQLGAFKFRIWFSFVALTYTSKKLVWSVVHCHYKSNHCNWDFVEYIQLWWFLTCSKTKLGNPKYAPGFM